MSPELNARDVAAIAMELQALQTPAETAEQVVKYAQHQLDADHAGITLITAKGSLETLAPTDPLVEAVDALQYELGEGACLDSSWEGQTLAAEDLSTDRRWPNWGPKVAASGIISALAAELRTDQRRIGAINLYWSRRRKISVDDAAYAQNFARHAALALQASLNEANLQVALDTRKLIGQAQGILMERFDLDDNQAFCVLKRYSQDHNIKLRMVAERLIETRRLPDDSRPGEHAWGISGEEPVGRG
jgi:GAF domain-containing protein